MSADDPGSDGTAVPSTDDVDPVKAALARARAAARARGSSPSSGAGPSSGSSRGSDARRGGSTRAGGPDGPPRSGPRPDARDPRLLGAAIDDLVAARGWESDAAVAGLVGRWDEIVGPDVAAHVSVETYEGESGRLVLRADSTAWATQLRLLLPTVHARIKAELGPAAVRELSVLGPAAPSWRKGRRHVAGRGPRDTYG